MDSLILPSSELSFHQSWSHWPKLVQIVPQPSTIDVLLCMCYILSQVIMATNRIVSLDPALIRPGGVDNITPETLLTPLPSFLVCR
jgi:SpoVK/Ycf46/Vps4 family AAA+-type ATPase